jgi:hypothetical protein
VFWGFLITICGWLIIQTILHTILTPQAYQSWNTIQCVTISQRPGTIGGQGGNSYTVPSWLSSVLPGLNTSAPSGIISSNGGGNNVNVTNTSYTCSGNATLVGQSCIDNTTGAISNAISNVTSTGGNNGAGSGAYSCPSGYTLDGGTGYVDDTGANATYTSCVQVDSNGNVTADVPPACTSGADPNANGQCTDVNGNIVNLPGSSNSVAATGARGVAQCTDGNTNCSISTLQSLGLSNSQANTMSCIAMTENSGQAVGCSGTGPCGTFQISQTNWKQYAPSSCSASNFGGNITAAQNNAACNSQTMAAMVQAQGYQPWTGSNNGVAWNTAASQCVANYASN